jgi:hypothetical protein
VVLVVVAYDAVHGGLYDRLVLLSLLQSSVVCERLALRPAAATLVDIRLILSNVRETYDACRRVVSGLALILSNSLRIILPL